MQIEANEKLCSHKEIESFYDRLGGWLDTQRFFKAPALNRLLHYSDFQHARYVFELGCGTGRLAQKILLSNPELVYHGTDLSSTMVNLGQTKWRMLHVSQASRFGLTSEVLVAEKRIEK